MLPPDAQSPALRIRVVAYLLLSGLTVLPLIDLLMTTSPWRISEVPWRFSAFAQLGSSAPMALVALLFLYAVAYANVDKKILYFFAAVAAMYAVLLIVATASFPFDALQMRRRVPQAALRRFTMGAAGGAFRLGFGAVVSAGLAISMFRAARYLGTLIVTDNDPGRSLVMRNLPGKPMPAMGNTLPAEATPGPTRVSDTPNPDSTIG